MPDVTGDPGPSGGAESGSFLTGVRVVELADELGEYCGKVLAGLGADVVKVEPIGGERTRGFGPFYQDEPNPNRSLHFWHYNFGKRSVVLELDSPRGQEQFRRLVATADVLLDSRPRDYLSDRGLSSESLRLADPRLIHSHISAFGDDGPWADFEGSDLIHLALGGVMHNCGYDARPDGWYDTPPIAPQMWQSYHIAGEVTAVQIMAALNFRSVSGLGQRLSTSVHDAVSKVTETDLPDWIYSRQPHGRRTARHSFAMSTSVPTPGAQSSTGYVPNIARTKDGRWLLPYSTYLGAFGVPFSSTVNTLAKYHAEEDLGEDRFSDPDYVRRPDVLNHVEAVTARFVGGLKYDEDVWIEAQANGLPWSPIRKPEENVDEEHWALRETFQDVGYPELGRTFRQCGAKWMAPGLPWRTGPRAPMLGEHNGDLPELTEPRPARPSPAVAPAEIDGHGDPFALAGVRVVDLSWLLASGGAGRFFTAHGAEVIKIEHRSRLDGMRLGRGVPPAGGRAERDAATGPLTTNSDGSVNRSGSFMEINAGKLSASINLKDPRGKELLVELIRDADFVIEGFSPGTMDRMGLGYDRLREINPAIIYVQQSGMGQIGTYGRLRSFGPTAQAFSGLTEMSGLPEPYAPAGIGFSYLDWFGSYQMAAAMMAALYRRRQTGLGCWIDSSQVEAGLYLTGTAILDKTANGRSWQRSGNASPYRPAAPHNVYPVQGEDRWLAIAAFTEAQWSAIVGILGTDAWAADPLLLDLDLRLANQHYLDELLAKATQGWEPYELMTALQGAGVPAGVCQTAQDRCENDPQLAHLGWLVELDQTEMGRWPVKEVPVTFSLTPPHVGGTLRRHGPNYGEDNDYVLHHLLGLSADEVDELARDGVI